MFTAGDSFSSPGIRKGHTVTGLGSAAKPDAHVGPSTVLGPPAPCLQLWFEEVGPFKPKKTGRFFMATGGLGKRGKQNQSSCPRTCLLWGLFDKQPGKPCLAALCGFCSRYRIHENQ